MMNSSMNHDAALRRKVGGSRIFKRKNFRGNRCSKCSNSATASDGSSTTTSTLKSTSAKKIPMKNHVYSNISAANMESDSEELFLDNNFLRSTTLLIDSDILKSIIKLLGTCPNCSNKSIDIIVINHKRKDYHFCYILYAIQKYAIGVSPFTQVNNWTQPLSVITGHLKSIIVPIAMREIGRGHTALKTFCSFMNMPAPMKIKLFNEMQQNIALVH